MADSIVSDNSWIAQTKFPIGIDAADIWRRITELHEWERETGQRLPLPAAYIVGVELRGDVVNLETGEHTLPPEYWPTPAGVAAARPWPVDEETSR